jgi:chromosome segregation ATPase
MPKKGQGAGGGPKTEDGKENSSKNSTKHGLCSSRKVLLPEEDPAEFAEVQRGWREEYHPEGHAENTLVDELIWAEWRLRRSRWRVMGAEERAEEDWTEATKSHLELMHRYMTGAERSFYRALNAVQSFRKDRLRQWEKEQKIQETVRELKSEINELKKRTEPVSEQQTAYASMRRTLAHSPAMARLGGSVFRSDQNPAGL